MMDTSNVGTWVGTVYQDVWLLKKRGIGKIEFLMNKYTRLSWLLGSLDIVFNVHLGFIINFPFRINVKHQLWE